MGFSAQTDSRRATVFANNAFEHRELGRAENAGVGRSKWNVFDLGELVPRDRHFTHFEDALTTQILEYRLVVVDNGSVRKRDIVGTCHRTEVPSVMLVVSKEQH